MHSPTGHSRRSGLAILVLTALFVGALDDRAEAYIGPGAGFAVGTTLVAFFAAFLSGLAAIGLWPFRWFLRFLRGRRAHARARVKRFVILGLDGMEPTLAERYMAEGKLPNLSKLKEQGTYSRLATTLPPLSPVAWSTFLTGCNPGKHAIFDFLTRDKRNYMPALSSVNIRPPSRTLKLGPYRIPLGKADIRLLRKGKPFWNVLGEHGIFSDIIRVPITFPPERFRGVLLSAMCVPDLRGSQGTFTYYTTRAAADDEFTSGETVRVRRDGDLVRAKLIGPENSVRENGGTMTCPFEVVVTAGRGSRTGVGRRRTLAPRPAAVGQFGHGWLCSTKGRYRRRGQKRSPGACRYRFGGGWTGVIASGNIRHGHSHHDRRPHSDGRRHRGAV